MARDGWEASADQARTRLSQLSQDDKIAIALHDFAVCLRRPTSCAFDYADGPNGVRGHHGATAFPSMLGHGGQLRPRAGRGVRGRPGAGDGGRRDET